MYQPYIFALGLFLFIALIEVWAQIISNWNLNEIMNVLKCSNGFPNGSDGCSWKIQAW